MGLFDILEDVIDAAIELPGKVLETTVETVVRIPEVGIKAVEGVVTGVEKGIEKVDKAIS
jgi:hypothetical protein